MSDSPENRGRAIRSQFRGLLTAVVAVILGCAPFIGRTILRSTVPPVWYRGRVCYLSSVTRSFLEQKIKDVFETALSTGGQLDASNEPRSGKNLASYRQEVTLLHDLHSKFEHALQAEKVEGWQPFEALKESVEALQSAERRAQHLNNIMMAAFTLVGAVFLALVLRSHTVPGWAKGVSMMAAGAITAGWFPL
jgi:hypothetical protein